MKKYAALIALVVLFSCTDNGGQDPASPGTLPTESADTTTLVTDSVIMRDSNTADIEAMKKIN